MAIQAMEADLLARGFDADAASRIAAAHAVPSRPFHEMTLEEVRAGDFMDRAASGPDVASIVDASVEGSYGEIPVRIYRPGAASAAPVLIWMHGGGWVVGGIESADTTCRHLASEAGVVVVSVGYRKAPEHPFPVAVEECYSVAKWAGSNAQSLGGDSNRLAVGGDSAGGTMAAAICLMARARFGPGLVFQLLVNPAADFDLERPSMVENAFPPMSGPADIRWFLELYLREERDFSDERAMPARAASHARLPRAFVLTAEFDILRDGGEAYAELLSAAGVPARAKRYRGVAHGFFNLTSELRRSREAMDDAVAELRDATSRAHAGIGRR
jgi:acetyl esterase